MTLISVNFYGAFSTDEGAVILRSVFPSNIVGIHSFRHDR